MPEGAKRFRPPRIDLARAKERKGPAIHVQGGSPVLGHISDDGASEDTLQLSDSDSTDSLSPTGPSKADTLPLPDDITKDLAALQQLRKSVQKNLRLRPIKSRSTLPKVNLDIDSVISGSPFSFLHESSGLETPLSSTDSNYYTPISETPRTAVFSANSVRHPTPLSSPLPPIKQAGRPISAQALYASLTSPTRPLLIDARPLAAHQSFHLRHSISIAIPSLILKRCRRPGGGLQSLDALRQFATTEQGKAEWDALMAAEGPWDGNVVVYDDEMDAKDKDNLGIAAWAIMPVISPLLAHGSVEYLEGGLSSAGHDPDLQTLIVSDVDGDTDASETSPPPQGGGFRKGAGLFQLDTQIALRSKKLPEIELASATSSNPPSGPPSPLPRSPLPIMSSTISSSRNNIPNTTNDKLLNIADTTPSPPPSSMGFKRPPPPRRPNSSGPNLRRLDTRSTDRLTSNPPKLSLRTKLRSATLAVPPTLSLNIGPPQSPSHLNLVHSNHSPTAFSAISPTRDPSSYLTPYYTPPHTPGTPRPFMPPSPSTAKPDLEPPTTEEAFPAFTVSTILPDFLFLGPELTTQQDVDELRKLGVKRILNIAVECDDDQGLNLKQVFDKYYKIPMRDTVEEENIAKGVKEACDILDDARLHSSPTYVHCKAGKSRSVTAVIAYLIHANHWTLNKAYAFVMERRKGISPNIGFVSELMNFEEQELGGKSIGVQPASGTSLPSGSVGDSSGGFPSQESGYSVAASSGMRRGAHVRESLPPGIGTDGIVSGGGPMSAGGLLDRVMGDSGQEMEIKDASGRYRHARRAPVDETTLQPMRRVSKAGLESSAYSES